MAYLNFYAKELSASDIANMAQQGMCSNIAAEDKKDYYRIIKWEDLLELGRSGTVTDLDILTKCLKDICSTLDSTVAGLEEEEQELEDVSNRLNSTLADLEEKEQELEDLSTRFNSTVAELEEKEQELEDVSNRLNSTVAELEESQADKFEMKEELDDISARLNSTVAELEQVTANRNASWDWDIFLAEQFLDQNLTAEHAQLLRSTWDDIAEALVGIRITDEFIKLLSRVDRVEDRPWSILYSDNYFEAVFTQEMAERLTSIWDEISEKLVGVTMSRGVIELLNYVTEKANCDTDTYS
ncbi:putative leucine-rich repeat-containing protein DDB_G0290503 [Bolinopsis microptera]|uniref:putative leucine-rich repeat-containing protein DDB_G0290503 n=1 Tax=Bolinopsis microptera TaxID=2820187 RepID=UPI00307A6AA6